MLKRILPVFVSMIIILSINSCSLFQGPVGPAGAMGPAGNPGTDGVDGTDGGYAVGGFLLCKLINLPLSSIGQTPAPTATLMVAFDPDHLLGSGNETIHEIPLAAYIAADDVHLSTTYEYPGVPEGDYFVYAWYSQDSDNSFDNTMEPDLYYLYTANGNGAFPEFVLDLANSEIDAATIGTLLPNFTVSSGYTPILDVDFNYDFGAG